MAALIIWSLLRRLRGACSEVDQHGLPFRKTVYRIRTPEALDRRDRGQPEPDS